jgi:hypothetical protein
MTTSALNSHLFDGKRCSHGEVCNAENPECVEIGGSSHPSLNLQVLASLRGHYEVGGNMDDTLGCFYKFFSFLWKETGRIIPFGDENRNHSSGLSTTGFSLSRWKTIKID